MSYNKKQLKSIFILVLAVIFIWGVAEAAWAISLDNFQITNSFGTAAHPDIIWTGSNYGLVWSDSRQGGEAEIYFIKLNEFGTKVTKELKISNSSDKISNQPAIVWADRAYGLVWSEYDRDESKNKDGCSLYFTKLDKEGEKYGGIVSVTSDNDGTCPSNPAISWTGLDYGITWHESRANAETSNIFFIRLNSLGERESQEIQVSDTSESSNSSIVWTGREYGLVWQTDEAIYFTRLDGQGVKQGNDIRVSNISATSTNPDIVWHDYGYGLVWQAYDEKGQRQIYFAELDEEGNKEIEKAITFNEEDDYSINPSIIWNNSEYGVVWQEEDGQIYFVNLDTKGHWKSKIAQISETEGQAKQPVITLGTSQYAFTWIDNLSGGEEIYFARLPFSDVAQNNLQFYLAFIKNLNGSSWLIIFSILVIIILLFGVIYLVKKKNNNG